MKSKDQRRKEATTRIEARNSRSAVEQLRVLDSRKVTARKERDRLLLKNS